MALHTSVHSCVLWCPVPDPLVALPPATVTVTLACRLGA